MSRSTLAGAIASGVLVVTLSACGGAATPSPAASTVAVVPSAPAASAAPSAAPSVEAPSTAPASTQPSVAIPSFTLPSEAKDLEALLPDKLCGATSIKLSVSGPTFAATADKSFIDALTAVGKTPADVAFAIATGAETGCTAGIFRVKGADGNVLKSALLAAQAKQGAATEKTVGGKDVYVTSESSTSTYVYFAGDAVIFASAKTESDAATILPSLP